MANEPAEHVLLGDDEIIVEAARRDGRGGLGFASVAERGLWMTVLAAPVSLT